MIKIDNLAIRRGDQLLFENVSQNIYHGDKIGLVGDNGSGKSSLFAAFLGEIHIDRGALDLPAAMRIAHVAQETPDNDRSALDHVIDGDRAFRDVQADLVAMDESHDESRAWLYSKMEDIDGYSVSARAAKLLSGLGFKTTEHHRLTSSFSGGWRVRLNLAQALMTPSDLLLLDEPTNHLDLDAIVWLEEWLKKYQGTLMLISHDRTLVDECCQQIFHINRNRIDRYSGNYTEFEHQRAKRLSTEHDLHQKQKKKVAHMENYIRRFRYKASKARQAQSRIKALEKLQEIVPAHAGSPFSFKFGPCDRLSDPIITLDDVDAGYGEQTVLSNINLSVSGGDRIGLLGANGGGKSTLIKIIAGALTPSSGTRQAAKHLKIGYFAQHQLEQMDGGLTPLQQFQHRYPTVTTQETRRFLGGFDFRGERSNQMIASLSGGEKARLALALLIYACPNFLLLDEPTNHLDMEMRHALNMAIQDYEGAIMLVSHDRSLIDSVTDQLVSVQAGKVTEFNDDMDAWLQLLKNKNKSEPSDAQKAGSSGSSADRSSKKKHRQLTAHYRQQLRPLREKINHLEHKMLAVRQEIESLDTILNDPNTYQTKSTATLIRLSQDKAGLEHELQSVETDWIETLEVLETQVEKIGSQKEK